MRLIVSMGEGLKVRRVGFEPTRPFGQLVLRPSCLPIPAPPPRKSVYAAAHASMLPGMQAGKSLGAALAALFCLSRALRVLGLRGRSRAGSHAAAGLRQRHAARPELPVGGQEGRRGPAPAGARARHRGPVLGRPAGAARLLPKRKRVKQKTRPVVQTKARRALRLLVQAQAARRLPRARHARWAAPSPPRASPPSASTSCARAPGRAPAAPTCARSSAGSPTSAT